MGYVQSPKGGYLLSAAPSGAGTAFDTRNTQNYGYLHASVPAASALVKLQASHDNSTWMDVSLVTAVAAGVTAQIAGYFPYVRGVAHTVYSGGGNTGYPTLHYSPGLL